MAAKKTTAKKKKNIKLSYGLLHVKTTPNNTIVTLTDENGNKILWGGTGLVGYKGSKQSTPYAAEVLTKEILSQAKQFGLTQVGIIFKGIGFIKKASLIFCSTHQIQITKKLNCWKNI